MGNPLLILSEVLFIFSLFIQRRAAGDLAVDATLVHVQIQRPTVVSVVRDFLELTATQVIVLFVIMWGVNYQTTK